MYTLITTVDDVLQDEFTFIMEHDARDTLEAWLACPFYHGDSPLDDKRKGYELWEGGFKIESRRARY